MVEKQAKLKKANAGITLIALVITVIVMLILAGVAINLTIGENGIFKKSQEGAEVYKNSANNEATSLNSIDKEMGDLLNKYQGGGTTTPSEKPGKPDGNDIYTENSTINGGEPSAFNPEIPKGFKPKDEGDAIWGNGTTPPTEEAVKAGLIIEDAEGNQFVWVAVDGETVKLSRYTFAEDGTETEQGEAVIDEGCEELASSDKGNTVAKDIDAFKTSVAEHGGYYIARYEASYGTDEKPNSKVSTSCDTSEPMVKGRLWYNITQQNAAAACRKMYDSTYGVTSDLVNSFAWDTAIVFIQKYSGDSRYSRQNSLNTRLANTGVNGDEKCHIHDMASNCFEWTTETSSNADVPCVFRSARFGDTKKEYYASCRYNTKVTTAYNGITFRPILYL